LVQTRLEKSIFKLQEVRNKDRILYQSVAMFMGP